MAACFQGCGTTICGKFITMWKSFSLMWKSHVRVNHTLVFFPMLHVKSVGRFGWGYFPFSFFFCVLLSPSPPLSPSYLRNATGVSRPECIVSNLLYSIYFTIVYNSYITVVASFFYANNFSSYFALIKVSRSCLHSVKIKQRRENNIKGEPWGCWV